MAEIKIGHSIHRRPTVAVADDGESHRGWTDDRKGAMRDTDKT